MELGMQRELKIWALDNWHKLCEEENRGKYESIRKIVAEKFDFVSDETKGNIINCTEPLPKHYVPPIKGRKLFFMKLFYPLIGIWLIVVALVIIALIYRLFI